MENKNKLKTILASVFGGIAFISAILVHINLSNVAVTGSESGKNWMKLVNSEKLLSDISIPGSHNSGSLYSIADLAGKCQDISIKNQLNIGVRYLDIRLELYLDTFYVVHNFVDQRLPFSSVIDTCEDFLHQHPSETIIMSIKEEVTTKVEGKFENKLKDVVARNKDLWFTEDRNPTLREVKGKIVLQSRYAGSTIGVPLYNAWAEPNESENTFSINNESALYVIQDYYKFDNIDKKWSEVEKCIEISKQNISSGTFTLNFLSGYLTNDFPPSYSVPTAKVINKKFIESVSQKGHLGIVIADFVSEELAKKVYSRNY